MELNQSGYSISELCKCARISRSSYYKWLNRKETQRDKENKEISNEIIKIYSEVKGIYGYRRITLNLNKTLGSNYNHKRIYRLMKSMNMSAVIRKKRKRYVHITPQITAENLLNRNFITENINEKWLTDVTEFKLTNGTKAKSMLIEVCFVDTEDANKYLSVGYKAIAKAIVDALDNHIVSDPVVDTNTSSTSQTQSTVTTTGDDWVRRLQQECNNQGFSKQNVDGIAGPATLAGCPTLKKGASGNITKLLQEKLVTLGYSTNGVDGIFGSGTYSAVREFQKTRGLSADGIVGQNTWRKLLNL